MTRTLTARDRQRLVGVHPDLARVLERARRDGSIPWRVTEGVRSMDRQAELAATGASRTMRSRHLTGHAVDLAVEDGRGGVRWDRPAYEALAAEILAAAKAEGVLVEWGGNFRGFFDGPHFQLPWRDYPA